MTQRHKKLSVLSLGLLSVGVVASVAAVSLPRSVQALECVVLPSSICESATNDGGSIENTGVWQLLLLVVNIMTGGVFVLALGGIVYASVLYTSAGGNQEQVKKARTMILNVVIGIVAFALMYALLQWLIPGGVFNSSGGLQAS